MDRPPPPPQPHQTTTATTSIATNATVSSICQKKFTVKNYKRRFVGFNVKANISHDNNQTLSAKTLQASVFFSHNPIWKRMTICHSISSTITATTMIESDLCRKVPDPKKGRLWKGLLSAFSLSLLTVLTKVLMNRKVYFLSIIRIILLLLACLKW